MGQGSGKHTYTLLAVVGSALAAYASLGPLAQLSVSTMQPLASTVATVAGILVGFLMASVTIIMSANNNALVQNTKLTNYLPGLLHRLHVAMAWLISVCVIFLVCMVIPETSFIQTDLSVLNGKKYLLIVLDVGVFIFCMSLYNFIMVWKEFTRFAKIL
ncbi:hypothetical protein [Geomonas edaphica]|uniref:hypothetical protein n=1 Tax=Geomonas edaphica TaxID=2570226 RepID=UPI0010A76FBC|nr:hypothetical protein [Geomonas edaphica]